jgi:hypothetical protein
MNNILKPSPNFKQQVAEYIEAPLRANLSGQLTTAKYYGILGTPRFSGRIANVVLSLGASGRDDTNALSLDADILINGTTALTTKPKISKVQAVASTHRTTNSSGQGVIKAVMASTNSYNAGDLITYACTLTRTATPTTEMANAALVVELRPND